MDVSTPHSLEPESKPADEYQRLLIALQDAAPGDLIFVQINSSDQRRQLSEKLVASGLRRSFATFDFAAFPPGPPPHSILREFLEDQKSAFPDILFVDGLEYWIDANPKPGGTLETLNLGRERLANLGVVLVFLLPTYLINIMRSYALNLWSWRAYYFEPGEAKDADTARTLSLDTGYRIASEDTPESRERRIRILRRLLQDGLAENRISDSSIHSILLPLAYELYNAGRFSEALSLLDKVKDLPEKREDLLDASAILHIRALVLQALHYFDKAKPLYRQALEIGKKILGAKHPDIGTILNNFGTLLFAQRKYTEAELLYQKALEIRKKALGQNHPDVASSLNNLAVLHDSQGNYTKAAALYEQALKILEKALGPRHPDVARSLSTLADLASILGQYTETEQYYKRAWEIWEKTLGPDHPLTAQCIEKYARFLRKTNRETEALELEARAKAIRAKNA